MFEMAICYAYNISYVGHYKYAMDLSERLKSRLSRLQHFFPSLLHTAEKQNRYDFTCGMRHLSAKTTKSPDGKVAPQVIGQAKPGKFCDILRIPYENDEKLKRYIQENILKILPILVYYTFDCQNIYYCEQTDKIKLIQLVKPIEWELYDYEWTRDWTVWNNSSTLKVGLIPILEIQFHSKSRSNMAIRWYYSNFLTVFRSNLDIFLL